MTCAPGRPPVAQTDPKRSSPASVLVVTDGACLGNPGPGGWAYWISFPDGAVRKHCGSERSTTNNRMELTAVIRALESLKEASRRTRTVPQKVRVLTDSQWLAFCASGKWKRKANLDLWKRYERAAAGMEIEWEWQPRNLTEPMREVDRLAKAAAARAC